jgi:hypothetical protein
MVILDKLAVVSSVMFYAKKVGLIELKKGGLSELILWNLCMVGLLRIELFLSPFVCGVGLYRVSVKLQKMCGVHMCAPTDGRYHTMR